jgi:arylsulfatase A-like enzyme
MCPQASACGFVQNTDFVPTFLEMLGVPDVDNTKARALVPS